MQEKLLPILVVALIGAAFALGMMWGKVSVYEKGAVAGTAGQVAGQTNQGAGQPAAPEEVVQLTDEQWQQVLTDPVAVKGNAGAAVTMVEFTDYQCPFCKRHFDETDSQIQKAYVETGKVRYVIRDLPLAFHANAKAAALAARCVGEQEKYWEMHDKLFQEQERWVSGDPAGVFKELAAAVGANVATFVSCYDSEKYNEAIEADIALASQMGATGTPTFFINGQKLVGAQPFGAFQQTLDSALGL